MDSNGRKDDGVQYIVSQAEKRLTTKIENEVGGLRTDLNTFMGSSREEHLELDKKFDNLEKKVDELLDR